jgi:hypothetical protein
MIDYRSFQYIFPPRPKNPIPHSDIKMWDNNTMMAQPKINGSNCTIYLDGKDMWAFNRHGQRLSGFNINKDEIYNLYKGDGWMVLNGEFTNKGKLDHDKKPFVNKFCLFDILVKDSNYLIGKTFQERYDLISNMYVNPQKYLQIISENVYVVGSFMSDFESQFNDLIKIDMVEGLVLKRKSAKLEIGSSELNNHKSQIKIRKTTKNYKF